MAAACISATAAQATALKDVTAQVAAGPYVLLSALDGNSTGVVRSALSAGVKGVGVCAGAVSRVAAIALAFAVNVGIR